MELRLLRGKYYRVKHGQTLADIARCFRVPLPLLCKCNALKEPPSEGEVLLLPSEGGNAYRVRGGESRALLCGSEENFEACNGTRALYIGQTVYLPKG